MDGDRLAGGPAHGGRICHAAGLHQCAAHGAHPQSVTFQEKTDVCLYPISDAEADAYIASGDPMDKAGAYGIQGDFAIYVKRIAGDYYNVVGLPIGRVYQELKRMLFVKK